MAPIYGPHKRMPVAGDGGGKYLQQRGDSWYVRIRVPPSLQAAAGGATHLREALHTKDKAIAERRKWPVITKLKKRLDELRKQQKSSASEPALDLHDAWYSEKARKVRAWAEHIRQLREEGDHEQADAIEELAQDRAEEIEAKHGYEVASRWFKAVMKTAKSLDELIEQWLQGSGLKEQTKATYRRAYSDL